MKRRKPLPIIEKRQCLRCGKQFGINAQQKNKLYCDDCRKIHKKEYDKKYNSLPGIQKKREDYLKKYRKEHFVPKRMKIKCERCGNEFLAGSGRPPTICIDCLSKSSNAAERARAYYRRDYSTEEQLRISD